MPLFRRRPTTADPVGGFAAAGAVGGVLAVIWLTLLWAAAPLLGAGDERSAAARLADRVRNAVVLGVGIPFVLGFAHALYGWTCLVAAALLALAARGLARRAARGGSAPRAARSTADVTGLAIAVAAVALAAWPQMVRPPLDGDTLAYHLPNALAWAHEHSVWTTGTRYWWYPGGSELFASGLIAVGARWSVPLAGAVAALLLVLRMSAWGSTPGALAGGLAGALVGAALIATPVAAPQAGSLQNDVWLAAALLEVLWVLLHSRSSRATIGAVALCTLIKPSGVLVALIAMVSHFVARATVRSGGRWAPAPAPAPARWLFSERVIDVLGGFIPVCLWIARDVVLAPSAVVPIASTSVAEPWATTIAGHGLAGLALLMSALWRAGLPVLALAVVPWVCLALWPALWPALAVGRRGGGRGPEDAPLRDGPTPLDASSDDSLRAAWVSLTVAGVLVGVLYVVSPFGFAGSVPQLASGASLRFDLPAMACGAVLLTLSATWAPRTPRAALAALSALAALAALAAAVGLVHVQAIFWNDAVTRSTVPVAAMAVVLLLAVARYGGTGRSGAHSVGDPPPGDPRAGGPRAWDPRSSTSGDGKRRRGTQTRVAAAAYALVTVALASAGALAGGRAVAFYDAQLAAAVRATGVTTAGGGAAHAGGASAGFTPIGDATAAGSATKAAAGVYATLLKLRPQRVVTWDLRAGSVGMLLPEALVYDALDHDACGEALRLGAVLVLGTDPDVPATVRAARRAMAERYCGRVLYHDAGAVMADPAAAPAP